MNNKNTQKSSKNVWAAAALVVCMGAVAAMYHFFGAPSNAPPPTATQAHKTTSQKATQSRKVASQKDGKLNELSPHDINRLMALRKAEAMVCCVKAEKSGIFKIIRKCAEHFNLPENNLLGVLQVESGLGKNSANKLSTAHGSTQQTVGTTVDWIWRHGNTCFSFVQELNPAAAEELRSCRNDMKNKNMRKLVNDYLHGRKLAPDDARLMKRVCALRDVDAVAIPLMCAEHAPRFHALLQKFIPRQTEFLGPHVLKALKIDTKEPSINVERYGFLLWMQNLGGGDLNQILKASRADSFLYVVLAGKDASENEKAYEIKKLEKNGFSKSTTVKDMIERLAVLFEGARQGCLAYQAGERLVPATGASETRVADTKKSTTTGKRRFAKTAQKTTPLQDRAAKIATTSRAKALRAKQAIPPPTRRQSAQCRTPHHG